MCACTVQAFTETAPPANFRCGGRTEASSAESHRGNRIIDEFSMSTHEAFDGLPSTNLGTQLSGDGIYQV